MNEKEMILFFVPSRASTSAKKEYLNFSHLNYGFLFNIKNENDDIGLNYFYSYSRIFSMIDISIHLFK